MSLPEVNINRKPLHTRTITVNTFARDDGMFDLEAELIDVKAYDFNLRSGEVHKTGKPVHHMNMRITIDREFTIKDAVASYGAAPYGQHCSSISPAYGKLVGLNLMRNFRNEVRKLFHKVNGCTHMTELTYVLPTVAVQTMAGQNPGDPTNAHDKTKKPFQLDGCHALRVDGPVAKKFYPIWYVEPQQDKIDS